MCQEKKDEKGSQIKKDSVDALIQTFGSCAKKAKEWLFIVSSNSTDHIRTNSTDEIANEKTKTWPPKETLQKGN